MSKNAEGNHSGLKTDSLTFDNISNASINKSLMVNYLWQFVPRALPITFNVSVNNNHVLKFTFNQNLDEVRYGLSGYANESWMNCSSDDNNTLFFNKSLG